MNKEYREVYEAAKLVLDGLSIHPSSFERPWGALISDVDENSPLLDKFVHLHRLVVKVGEIIEPKNKERTNEC